jgi:uncharacterized membrane protein
MVINYNYFQSVKGYDNIKFIMLKQFGALPPSQLVLIVALSTGRGWIANSFGYLQDGCG